MQGWYCSSIAIWGSAVLGWNNSWTLKPDALWCPGRGDEPDPIKRLKREMAVALQEEDYKTAGYTPCDPSAHSMLVSSTQH